MSEDTRYAVAEEGRVYTATSANVTLNSANAMATVQIPLVGNSVRTSVRQAFKNNNSYTGFIGLIRSSTSNEVVFALTMDYVQPAFRFRCATCIPIACMACILIDLIDFIR